MDNEKKPDWRKLSSCCIRSTLAFENARKCFKKCSEEFCCNVAALALIEKAFPDGYFCPLEEIKSVMKRKFGIKNPLEESPWLSSSFFFETTEAEKATTHRWLVKMTDTPVEEWKYDLPRELKDLGEEGQEFLEHASDRISDDVSTVLLLKKFKECGLPFIWSFGTPDFNTLYSYLSSLKKEGISCILFNPVKNHIAEILCIASVKNALPVFFSYRKRMKDVCVNECNCSFPVRNIDRFVFDMGFQIAYAEETDVYNQHSENMEAVHVRTELKPLNYYDCAYMFGDKTEMVIKEAKAAGIDDKTLFGIRKTVNTFVSSCGDDKEIGEMLRMLGSVFKEKNGMKNDELAERYDTHYSPEVLNISVSVETLKRMVKKHKDRACAFLFSGPSGTGKTAFAKYLATEMNCELLTAKVSDIKGDRVGSTERNTAELFSKAKQKRSILLIDEVDSFLCRRDRSDPNVWLNSQMTNQFLQEMEDFNGIFIGTTNMMNMIDPSFIRRFNKVIEFRYLSENGIRELLARYFPELHFTEKQIISLTETESLGAGDFGTVFSTCEYLEEEEITSDYVTKSLLESCTAREGVRKKHMGFCIN